MKRKLARLLGWIIGLLIVSVAIFYVSTVSARLEPTHPLDRLTVAEVNAVVAILKSAGKVNNASRFATVRLQPTLKAEVWDWQLGEAIPSRKAFVSIKERLKFYESVVDRNIKRIMAM